MGTNYGEDPATDEELVQYVKLRTEGGEFGPDIERIESIYYRLDEADLRRIEAEYDRRYPNSGRGSSEGPISVGDSASGREIREETARGSNSPRGGRYTWVADDDSSGRDSSEKNSSITGNCSPRGTVSPRAK